VHRDLKDDKRAVFVAASHLQKVADYLSGLQPGAETGLRSYSSVTDFTISPLSTVPASRATVALPV
jgi:antirestriction protein ArdC